MKRLHTGVILFDTIDILCISFSVGSGLAYLIRKKKGNVDPIVAELKKKSPVIAVSTDGKPLKIPVVRGGADAFKGVSLTIKSKRLAVLIRAIIDLRKKQKQLKLLQIFFATLNALLSSSVGLRFAVGGSLDYTQIILIALPSTVSGFLIGQVLANPLLTVFLPLAIFYGREIEDIPDPYEKCKLLCKAAEEFHNKELGIVMEKLNSLVEDASDALQLPLDQVPLVCTENKLSLTQRFRLKEVIRSAKARKRVQHFSEFIKKFPECDADPETVFQEIMETGQTVKNG